MSCCYFKNNFIL